MSGEKTVLRAPIVSEKSYGLMDKGAYVFLVDARASKVEIREAVEAAFTVRVKSVNTLIRKGKRKRNRKAGGFGRTSDEKRAIVRLVGDDRIELFES